MGSMGGQGGSGGGWLTDLLMPIPYKSGAKPGPGNIPAAQPMQPQPMLGPAQQSQNPLTQYIMALTSSRLG